MADDVLRAVGEVVGAVREPKANRPPGVVYAKCALKYSFGGAWALGVAYILGKYNADPEQMINIFQNIALPAGVMLMGMSTGCLKLSLQADSLSSLKELWKRYTLGILQDALSEALLTPDLLQFAEEGKDVQLEVQIGEKIYREACLDLMVKSVIKGHQDGRNTSSLSRRRCQSESNINLLLTASPGLNALSLEEKPHIERQEIKRGIQAEGEISDLSPPLSTPRMMEFEAVGVTDMSPIEPIRPGDRTHFDVSDRQSPSDPTVLYLNIDDEKVFEESQIKSTSKGTQQRIVNGKVNMLAKSKSQLSHIKVWIFRELARQELSVTYGYWRDFETNFSVNIDDVYAEPEGPFYALSTVDAKRRNEFQLSSVLYFKDGTKSKEFLSEPFSAFTAKPLSEAAIGTLPIPAQELGDTYIEVHTLVSDLVYASKVKSKEILKKTSLDFSAAKSEEKLSPVSKVCTNLVGADRLIARTIICESISTSSESENIQGLDAERVRERFIKTRSRKRKKIEDTTISREFEYPEESTSTLTTQVIKVERLIVRCLTCDEMECIKH